ncbi:MAG: hypothetical protein JWN79_3347 [Gemmatimonadetes bacterium]|jgi:hypothetical protein|nr:hypothetical protein [Gemmatimonadota bacterium]
MPASALRPRSVTEIVDAAFQIFRAHAGALVMCSAVAYIPTLFVRFLLLRDLQSLGTPDPSRLGELAAHTGYTWLATILSYALMTATLTICASQAYLGEEVDVAAAVRRVASRLLPFLVATLLVSALTLVAFAFLFFPAMYVTARYFAVAPAMLLEDRGIFGAMSRSSELSLRRKWHILNTLGLVILIYFVLLVGLTLVSAMIGGVAVQAILGAVVTICIYPVIAITGVLLYYDARIQSEGLDIELMADALGPAPTPLVR